MLNISNLSVHFAGRYLFDGISLTIGNNDKIGLIGRNGSGKTTLLKILAGIESAETGTVIKPNDYTIGYLPQEAEIHSEKSLFDEASLALGELCSVQSQIDALSRELSERTDYESKDYTALTGRLGILNDRFRLLGGASVDSEIEHILLGLGFRRNDFKKKISEFSGGWQMRLELAKILLGKPDCILLDEPTNHLDIDSIGWLENFLGNYKGAVVIVSHDRNFLNSVTGRTIEISLGKIYDSPLPYSKFIELRAEQRKMLEATYQNQQRQIAQTERFIERFRYKATLASRVQSRIKQLEKLETIELEDEDYSSINFSFPPARRSGRLIAEAVQMSKSYGTNTVLDKIDFAIERGDKIAFVGRNGEGKSTLSRILAGMESCDGTVNKGYNIDLAYYDQHQAAMLDGESTVFDIIDTVATGEMRTKIRSLLGAFLFRGEDIYKKVKVLSGGEKSRLAIARMLLSPANFMILDEPTNHLDMVAKDVLKNALMKYDGTLVIVSHDRDFLDGLTDITVYFREGKINRYDGGIYEFLERQGIGTLYETEKQNKKIRREFEAGTIPGKAQEERLRQKQHQRDIRKIQKNIEEAEKEIGRLESCIHSIEESFAKPEIYSAPARIQDLKNEYESLRLRLDSQTEEWIALQEALEELTRNKP